VTAVSPATLKEVTLYIGGVHASAEPTLIKTLLGSCIAVCLWDPAARVGGMNHFMLPQGDGHGDDLTRFGVHAMDSLIGATMKAGGERRRLTAKLFGGAHVLDIAVSEGGVPQRNVDFVQKFLEREGFPVLSADVGGHQPRYVHFFTDTGRARVKRVTSVTGRPRLEPYEKPRKAPAPTYGSVTLFE
jgi:chemotaxis receptor (MCP) glutamine deamidase CheD